MTESARSIRWLAVLPHVLAGYTLRLLVAVVVTHPFSALVKRTLGGWPDGDRMLYQPGGLMLSETVRLHRVQISGFAEQSALVALAMIPVGMFTTALVLSALASTDARDLRAVTANAVGRFVPVAALTLIQVIGVSGSLFLTFVLREGLASALPDDWSSRTGDLVSGAVLVLGAAAACAFVIATDTGRVAAVRRGLDTADASVHALSVMHRRLGPLVAAFGARASASLLAAVLAVSGTLWLGLESPARAIAALSLQQSMLLVMALLRVSWYARAMAILGEAGPSATGSDRSPRIGDPNDPSRDRDS